MSAHLESTAKDEIGCTCAAEGCDDCAECTTSECLCPRCDHAG